MNTLATSRAVPFAPPAIDHEEIAEVVATLESGWLTSGPRVKSFEAAFAAYTGAPYAIGLNSCTAGLHLALLAAGLGPGDEAITTPLTFCATANTIVHTGATPVFADVDRRTMNISVDAIAAAITPRTRAIVPVHFGGRPVDVQGIRALADRHGLVVIEDAAHAIEAVSLAGKVGSTGDFTSFSFYATKNVTTGEGGMLTMRSEQHAAWIRTASLHGMSRDAWARYTPGAAGDYDVVTAGYKYNMMDLQAALGLRQLEKVERHLQRREQIWRTYDDAFASLPVTVPAPAEEGTRHARHLYTILVDAEQCGVGRDTFRERLRNAGISTSLHFRALHLHSFYAERFGMRRGMFPNAEHISDRTVSLPLSPALTDGEIDRVIGAVREALA